MASLQAALAPLEAALAPMHAALASKLPPGLPPGPSAAAIMACTLLVGLLGAYHLLLRPFLRRSLPPTPPFIPPLLGDTIALSSGDPLKLFWARCVLVQHCSCLPGREKAASFAFLPPARPWPLPLLPHALSLNPHTHRRYKKYGSVFEVRLLHQPLYVVTEAQDLRQFLRSDDVAFFELPFPSFQMLMGKPSPMRHGRDAHAVWVSGAR